MLCVCCCCCGQEVQLRVPVLQQHAALIGGPNATACPLCHKLFLGGDALMDHMKHAHKDPATGVASKYLIHFNLTYTLYVDLSRSPIPASYCGIIEVYIHNLRPFSMVWRVCGVRGCCLREGADCPVQRVCRSFCDEVLPSPVATPVGRSPVGFLFHYAPAACSRIVQGCGPAPARPRYEKLAVRKASFYAK